MTPEKKTVSQCIDSSYARGWNDCVDEISRLSPTHMTEAEARAKAAEIMQRGRAKTLLVAIEEALASLESGMVTGAVGTLREAQTDDKSFYRDTQPLSLLHEARKYLDLIGKPVMAVTVCDAQALAVRIDHFIYIERGVGEGKEFAKAFAHACDSEGTYFGLGEDIYRRACIVAATHSPSPAMESTPPIPQPAQEKCFWCKGRGKTENNYYPTQDTCWKCDGTGFEPAQEEK